MTDSSGYYTVDLVNIMRTCIIKSCKNSSRKVKEVSFFYFPKDPVQQEKWKISTGCEPDKYSTVCELHFDTDEVTTNKNHKKLKKGAIPRHCEPHPPNAAVGYAQVTKGKSTHVNVLFEVIILC